MCIPTLQCICFVMISEGHLSGMICCFSCLYMHANKLALRMRAGIDNATAFGQHESLTRRLKNILALYPEGPGVLYEMIQNADDAGASEVCFMLNMDSYGDNSLLGPKLKCWQGPALYVYNNATFTENDFQNLSQIGQASKLDKVSATGRFGLGFNAVYHFTDLPSFVSGSSIVILDPHSNYLPGTTIRQPGLRIGFVNRDGKDGNDLNAEADVRKSPPKTHRHSHSNTHASDSENSDDDDDDKLDDDDRNTETQAQLRLDQQFPDQFSPYMHFGCDLQHEFDGTLFRFPLRTASTAARSGIKQKTFSSEDVIKLLMLTFGGSGHVNAQGNQDANASSKPHSFTTDATIDGQEKSEGDTKTLAGENSKGGSVKSMHALHSSSSSTSSLQTQAMQVLLFLRSVERVKVMVRKNNTTCMLFDIRVLNANSFRRQSVWSRIPGFIQGNDTNQKNAYSDNTGMNRHRNESNDRDEGQSRGDSMAALRSNRFISKNVFYNRLATCHRSELPRGCSIARIEMKDYNFNYLQHDWKLEQHPPHTEADELQDNADDDCIADVDGSDTSESVVHSKYPLVSAPSSSPVYTLHEDEFIVYERLGGDKRAAQKLAVSEQSRHLKLLPWGGVAARIKHNTRTITFTQSRETPGKAYCFLPLPVLTGLPVHVNGYFELSANRRDIWWGEDMTGDGGLRSEWNRVLIGTVIAPSYTSLIKHATKVLFTDDGDGQHVGESNVESGGQKTDGKASALASHSLVLSSSSPSSSSLLQKLSTFYSLWPVQSSSPAWEVLIAAVYKRLAQVQAVYTPLHKGRWILPSQAICVDETMGVTHAQLLDIHAAMKGKQGGMETTSSANDSNNSEQKTGSTGSGDDGATTDETASEGKKRGNNVQASGRANSGIDGAGTGIVAAAATAKALDAGVLVRILLSNSIPLTYLHSRYQKLLQENGTIDLSLPTPVSIWRVLCICSVDTRIHTRIHTEDVFSRFVHKYVTML